MEKGRSRIDMRALTLAAGTLALQCAVYWLAQFIIKRFGFELHSPQTALDELIPFLPGFLLPYIGCFLHWAASFYLVYRTRDGFAHLFTAAVIGYAVSFAVYLLWPTTISRPLAKAQGVWGFVYGVICAADAPLNLFPSMHCMVAYICMAASFYAARNAHLPRAYAWLGAAMFALVCLATVFVKQHFIIDVFGGAVLGAAAWRLAALRCIRRPAESIYKAFQR